MNLNKHLALLSVLLVFFTMGFVDLAGIATNNIKHDFSLSDTSANLFPSIIFLWFILLAIPTSLLMDKIGRKNTVLISLIFTIFSMIFTILNYSLPMMAISFCFLGIGNALMQVSLNPLLSNVVEKRELTGFLTLGQSIKTVFSLTAPLVIGWAALKLGDWKAAYPVFIIIAILITIFLWRSNIKQEIIKKSITFKEFPELINRKQIILCFIAIACHVGIDVGTNITAPKILMERLSVPLASAGIGISIYFFFKMAGALCGAFMLSGKNVKAVFKISVLLLFLGIGGLIIADSGKLIYVCMAATGLGNANIFSIIYYQAVMENPKKQNEISGLLIMGLSGGAIFPLLMGISSDYYHSQSAAAVVMLFAVLYLAFMAGRIKQIS